MDVGEAEVAAGIAIGQPRVIKTHQMQNGRVEIVHVDRIFDSRSTVLIGDTVAVASLGPSPDKETREIAVVMPSTLGIRILPRSSPEFRATYYQGVVQHSALAQIFDQGRNR